MADDEFEPRTDMEAALALSLQRLRQASRNLLQALEQNDELGKSLSELESAVYCSSLQSSHLLRWADETLASVVIRRRPRIDRSKLKLKRRVDAAARVGIYVHQVVAANGQSWAVYRDHVRLGAARSPASLYTLLGRLLRAE